MSALPKTVFKYEGFNINSLMNFKKQSIYFGSPVQFNDPYDCTITARILDPTPEGLERLRLHYVKLAAERENLKGMRRLESATEEVLRKLLKSMAEGIFEAHKKRFLTTYGVSCFSEVNDDLLMWAHYSDGYRGFCLEFRTDYEPFTMLRQVNYVDHIPELDVVALICDEDIEDLIDVYCTKSAAWAYEREWRGIETEREMFVSYVPEALKAVYFGPKIDTQTVELFCLILACQNPDVELWLVLRPV